MRTKSVAAAVAAASVSIVLVAGCGGDSDDDKAFEGQSADAIAAKAVEATKQAKSVHMKGDTRTENGSMVTIDVSADQDKNCQGTVGSQGAKADVRHTGATLYLRGDEKYWRQSLKGQPETARKAVPKLQGKWVKMSAGDDQLSGVCDKQGVLSAMDEDKSERKGMKRGGTTEVDGEKAIKLTKQGSAGETMELYVATEGKPYILKTTTKGGKNPGSVTFDDYNEPVKPEQPPAGETIDMKELADGQRA
ncbi:hypothetical protein NX794_00635 [Streptomyces sp. LP11]|uniref:Lipoprotein n=1 Tax=Streptomyces pyxinicus TaxID=2970331 RepID=A0ABT2AU33_9ACTN|nr:hypothetical protein [Streptomyces sp. LP11]MCS0599754.1 hypothetical protein [Streptomyces sp. LP11]